MSTKDFDPDAAAQGDGVFGLPHSAEQAGVVLVPVPWDVTTSYRAGTSNGPEAIRTASRQVDLHDVETGTPWRAGIHMLPEPLEVYAWNSEGRMLARPIIELGGELDDMPALKDDLARVNKLGGALNDWVAETTERHLAQDKLVGIVGGDHSVPLGAIATIARRHPGLGILHVDAHADLRRAYEGFTFSHASIMYNVMERVSGVARLVQVGLRDVGEAELEYAAGSKGRVVSFFDAKLQAKRFEGESWAHQCQQIVQLLPREVWVSFDIDGLDPACCPHTGTPVPGGLSFAQACYLLAEVARQDKRIVGFDLNEVSPGPLGKDGRPVDDWDANVGARLLYKLIGWAVRTRPL